MLYDGDNALEGNAPKVNHEGSEVAKDEKSCEECEVEQRHWVGSGQSIELRMCYALWLDCTLKHRTNPGQGRLERRCRLPCES